jgi:hypothetical protein
MSRLDNWYPYRSDNTFRMLIRGLTHKELSGLVKWQKERLNDDPEDARRLLTIIAEEENRRLEGFYER